MKTITEIELEFLKCNLRHYRLGFEDTFFTYILFFISYHKYSHCLDVTFCSHFLLVECISAPVLAINTDPSTLVH